MEGVFHPSLEATYDCRVNSPAASTLSLGYGVEILLHSGEVRLQRTDVSLPGRGGSLQASIVFTRTYRSRLEYAGPVGYGWDHSYNKRLEAYEGGVWYYNGQGRRDLFAEPEGEGGGASGRRGEAISVRAGWQTLRTWAASLARMATETDYVSPTGVFAMLRQHAHGSFTLRFPDGSRELFDSDGLLERTEDAEGSGVDAVYSSGLLVELVNDYGQTVEIDWTTSGGLDVIESVTDWSGREVSYSYDDGDLVDVTMPAVSGTSTGNDFTATETYEYDPSPTYSTNEHNLVSVTFPEEVAVSGDPAMTFEYSETPHWTDQVLESTVGGENASNVDAGGTWGISYATLNGGAGSGQPALPRRKAAVTERNGNEQERSINEYGHEIWVRELTQGLRAGEPDYYQTLAAYNADGLLRSQTRPLGNRVELSYDSTGMRFHQANLLEMRQIADATRGGGEDLVTAYTYDPLRCQVVTITDPRGLAEDFEPPLGTPSAARYTTTFYVDWQESSSEVAEAADWGIDTEVLDRGLGDLNADGVTNQQTGNIIRRQGPTVTLVSGSNMAVRLGSTAQEVLVEIQRNSLGQVNQLIDEEGNVTEWERYPANDPDGDGTTVPGNSDTSATGYVKAVVVDSETSARRTTSSAPNELRTEYDYDDAGNVIQVLNPRGVRTDIEVNQLDEVVSVTRGADVSAAASSGELVTGESALSLVSRFYYNANGWVVKTEQEVAPDTIGIGAWLERDLEYDILGNLLEESLELNSSTRVVTNHYYDASQLHVQTLWPEGNLDRTQFDERNLPFRITRGVGESESSRVQIDYDWNGNRIKVTDAEDTDGVGGAEETLFEYDGFDRMIAALDDLGGEVQIDLDVASQRVEVRAWGHPAGNPGGSPVLHKQTRFAHDELGRVYHGADSLFVASGFSPVRTPVLLDDDSDGWVERVSELDALSRLVFAVEDDGEVTEAVYDGSGRVVEAIDALGNSVATVFDQNGNPTTVTEVDISPEALVDDETFITINVFDQLDRLVRTTDNVGQTHRFTFDSRDNLTTTTDPMGSLINDPWSLYTGGQINNVGNSKTLVYDGLNRRVKEISDLRVGGVGSGSIDTSNSYNSDGKVTVTFAFDLNSRLVGILDDKDNETSFGYDALNRRISQTNADAGSWSYTWDRDSNLTLVVDPMGSISERTFDALHRQVLVEVDRGTDVGGTTEEVYEWDGLGRLTLASDNNGSSSTVQTVERVYDSVGRLIEEQENGEAVSSVFEGDGKRQSVTYPGGREISYDFDELDRPKTATDDGGTDIWDADYIGPGMRELRRVMGNGSRLTYLNAAENLDVGYDSVRRVRIWFK